MNHVIRGIVFGVVLWSAATAVSPGMAVAQAPARPVAAAPVPSSPLRVYKGPEGEQIAMLEVNGSKQMLVHFKNLGGELEGKTLLYQFEDNGDDSKNVFLNKKRGSKWHREYVLSARRKSWEFYHPFKPNTKLDLSYSESASEKLKVEDVLKAYKP